MFGNVRECSAPRDSAGCGTNPTPQSSQLSPRQVAAARLLILGRCGRDVARELEVEEHTITRWRRMPAFRAEIQRQLASIFPAARQQVRR
jgi:FixJ family two-component response regulator